MPETADTLPSVLVATLEIMLAGGFSFLLWTFREAPGARTLRLSFASSAFFCAVLAFVVLIHG